MNVLIGNAWPYANGSLHIGHIASLLPGDVLARYHRLAGDRVFMVSGSDCHGTPVSIRAKQEGKSPFEISEQYHLEFVECFNKLGFSYDNYDKTSSEQHKSFVMDFHKKLYESDYVYEKNVLQAYCETCDRFLADRFVEGVCPTCGQKARGDQCDSCTTVLEPENLLNPVCTICGGTPSFRETSQLYLALTKLLDRLNAYIDSHDQWRKNAFTFSKRYLDEGLRDRAITRSLDWGIDVPKDGYDDKRIYIWAENVLGYLSASQTVYGQEAYDELWTGDDTKHYYVHGKDNIPFHSIILPALLLAWDNGKGSLHLPDEIVSSEYLTLEGRKISTSQGYALWVKDIIDLYNPDAIRYFLIANGPEKKDTDFTMQEFVNSNNGELLGAYGNLVNRTLTFVKKYFEDKIPDGVPDTDIASKTAELYDIVGQKISSGQFKDALETVFSFVRESNKYFDTMKPWATRTSDPEECKTAIYNCVQVIANAAVLLEPFLPFSSEKVKSWLNLDSSWAKKEVPAGLEIGEIGILFERLTYSKE